MRDKPRQDDAKDEKRLVQKPNTRFLFPENDFPQISQRISEGKTSVSDIHAEDPQPVPRLCVLRGENGAYSEERWNSNDEEEAKEHSTVTKCMTKEDQCGSHEPLAESHRIGNRDKEAHESALPPLLSQEKKLREEDAQENKRNGENGMVIHAAREKCREKEKRKTSRERQCFKKVIPQEVENREEAEKGNKKSGSLSLHSGKQEDSHEQRITRHP
jgi:hypothetical protein